MADEHLYGPLCLPQQGYDSPQLIDVNKLLDSAVEVPSTKGQRRSLFYTHVDLIQATLFSHTSYRLPGSRRSITARRVRGGMVVGVEALQAQTAHTSYCRGSVKS